MHIHWHFDNIFMFALDSHKPNADVNKKGLPYFQLYVAYEKSMKGQPQNILPFIFNKIRGSFCIGILTNQDASKEN